MQEQNQREDSPDQFLKLLGDNLKAMEGVDTALADILKTHLLKASPTQDAVVQAKNAILKLASERITPPKPEAGNG